MKSLISSFSFILMSGHLFLVQGKPAPELPGEEITEAESALEKSDELAKPIYKQRKVLKKNWRAPRIEEQLARDKTLIGMGYGALFAPTFTESRLEPDILVFQKMNKTTAEGLPGQRILLEEGDYTVLIGSGNISLRMRYHVKVEEGHTTILKPDWSGLIVETINPDNDYIREEYEIIELVSGIPYGKGYGQKEDRMEDIKTWILRPGLYRITRVGADLTSLTNYITIQLNPGELTVVEIVFDEDSGDLIAGGVKSLNTSTKAFTNWRYGIRAGGNINFFKKIKEKEESITALADFKLRAKYDNFKILGINNLRLRNSFEKAKDQDFLPKDDELQFRSTWVRRINNWLGPYVRGKIESHIFPRNFSGDTAYQVNNNNDTLKKVTSDQNFELQPSLLPIEISEGIGINVEIFSLYNLEFSTLLGTAAKQYISKDIWKVENPPVKGGKDLIKSDEPKPEFGIENGINARVRMGTRFSIDLLAELFIPLYPDFKLTQDKYYDYFKIDDFIVDFRFNLTRQIELSYIFEIEDRKQQYEQDPNLRFEQKHNVLLRLSINI